MEATESDVFKRRNSAFSHAEPGQILQRCLPGFFLKAGQMLLGNAAEVRCLPDAGQGRKVFLKIAACLTDKGGTSVCRSIQRAEEAAQKAVEKFAALIGKRAGSAAFLEEAEKTGDRGAYGRQGKDSAGKPLNRILEGSAAAP